MQLELLEMRIKKKKLIKKSVKFKKYLKIF